MLQPGGHFTPPPPVAGKRRKEWLLGEGLKGAKLITFVSGKCVVTQSSATLIDKFDMYH